MVTYHEIQATTAVRPPLACPSQASEKLTVRALAATAASLRIYPAADVPRTDGAIAHSSQGCAATPSRARSHLPAVPQRGLGPIRRVRATTKGGETAQRIK
jgi:hypothetical protein